MKKKRVIILGFIILIATILRFWNLGTIPSSPDWDEASLAYNAYSLLHTGKDEYGKFMPIVFESFGDYKPALYSYIAIPFIAFFGLDTFAIRFPSAILGVLTVLAVYFLVKELLQVRDKEKKVFPVETTALLAAFLLAISPWHIQFSRVAFETNVGLAFNIFGALFFLKSLKKPWLLSLATIFWGLSISVYQSEKVFTPLLAILFAVFYRKDLFTLPKKNIIIACLFGFLVILPLLFYSLSNKDVFSRAQSVSIFAEETKDIESERINLRDDRNSHNELGAIIHNRRVVYLREIVGGYFSHFDLNWLFIKGDDSRHHAPGMGLLYLFELPLLLIGIYLLFFSQISKRTKIIIIGWLLLAPVPAAFTKDVPHAVRTLNFLPMFQILIAFGTIGTYRYLQKYATKKYFLRAFLIVVALSFVGFNMLYYLNQYFVQQNYFYSEDWQYGYKEAVSKVQKLGRDYDHIIISNVAPLDQSYIFFLFYLKYPPSQYQTVVNGKHNFEKYIFRPINWEKDKENKNTLFVGSPKDFPDNIKTEKTIYFLDGKPAIKIVGIK